MLKCNFMKLEHLDFITFCVGSLADVLHTFGKDYIVEDLTEALREKGALA